MKDQKRLNKHPPLKDLKILFLTFFGAGFFPFASGTFASLVSIPFCFPLSYWHISWWWSVPFIITLTIFSSYVADLAQKEFSVHDPSWIVIDEVIGMFVAWIIVRPEGPLSIFLLFLIFRFFDIVKIWPASYFDKKVYAGYGTILDDVVSGIYTGFVMILLKLVLPYA